MYWGDSLSDFETTPARRRRLRLVAAAAAACVLAAAPSAALGLASSSGGLVSVGDHVWLDVNRDGMQTAGEPPVGAVGVSLIDAQGNLVDTTDTDGAGHYAFVNLGAAETYSVSFSAPEGYSFTTSGVGAREGDSNGPVVSFDAPAGGSNEASNPDDPTLDAGLVAYNLTLAKAIDTPAPYWPGRQVSFTLTPHNEGPTDALPGWSVTDVLPAGLTLVSIDGGDSYSCSAVEVRCVSSVPLRAGKDGQPITVVATIGKDVGNKKLHNVAYIEHAGSDVAETVPLGESPGTGTNTDSTATDNDAQAWVSVGVASVGNYVWIDVNHDGRQDASDIPVAGATLTLTTVTGDPVTDVFGILVGPLTTDAAGHYLFDSLPPGQYVVHVDPSTAPALAGALPTLAGIGNGAGDSSTGSATSETLGYSDQDLSLDFGFWLPAPSIEIVKTDAAGHDANSPGDAVNDGDGIIDLAYTVTNTGNEDLVNVQVGDTVNQGGKVTDFVCEFPDGSSGTTWSGPFVVGTSFECTATLHAPNGDHKNTASVTADGASSGTEVADTDPFYAVIDAPSDVSPDTDNGDNDGEGALPNTGAPVSSGLVFGAAATLVAGMALMIASRRRRG